MALLRRLFTPIGKERPGSSFWSVIEHISLPTLQFASAFPLVGGLGVAGYGQWVYILGIATMVGALSPGFSMAATQQISGETCEEKKVSAAAIAVGFGLIAVLIFSALGATAFLYILENSPPQALIELEVTPGLLAVLVAITGAAIQWDHINAAVLRANLQFRLASLIEISSRAISLLVLGVFVLWSGNIIAALVINSILIFIKGALKASFIFWSKPAPKVRTMAGLISPSIKFSILHWPQSFNAIAYMFSDRVVLGYFASSSVVAIASLASQVAAQLHSVPRAFLAPLAPALINIARNEDDLAYKEALRASWSKLRFLVVVLLPAIMVLGLPIIQTVLQFSVSWSQVFAILICYLFGYFVMSLTIIPHVNFVGRQQVGRASIVALAGAACNAVSSVLLGAFWGVFGVALAKSAYAIPYAFLGPRSSSRKCGHDEN